VARATGAIAMGAGIRYVRCVRRPVAITLLLLGGGAFTAALSALPTRRGECEQARAAGRPDAEAICSRAASSGSSGHGGYWSSGRSSSSSKASSSSSSSRGGFGSPASFSGG